MANLTRKQEHFCYEYLRLGNASAAYRLGHDAAKMSHVTINRKAKRLRDNPKIATRLEIAREKAAKKLDITLESLTAMLVKDRLLAREIRRPEVAIEAVAKIAELHGIGDAKSGKPNSVTDQPPGIPDIA